jgi:hypothetical protein
MQMCCIADMWDAESCLRLCFAALALLQADELSSAEFAGVLALLPETVTSSPEQEAWQQVCNAVTAALVSKHSDVHKMLTDPDQLLQFQQLPFVAIKAWAASDGLVVDSEDSVVLALSRWVVREEGSKCSEAQLEELSGLMRVKHLTPGMADKCCLQQEMQQPCRSCQLQWGNKCKQLFNFI